ncbi:UNKNOWN [Stylonychia lemnae]|uniref:Uncharacterized protein n=1 Tax=Stylonychia lemnae TaxID=5949 RepID=A0A078AC04_STYLE|nr:UNKNOWN [Stylonychia lemnae]|eukprot:CDW79734.1 UNKNOWN [Stylonychia lemnae]
MNKLSFLLLALFALIGIVYGNDERDLGRRWLANPDSDESSDRALESNQNDLRDLAQAKRPKRELDETADRELQKTRAKKLRDLSLEMDQNN